MSQGFDPFAIETCGVQLIEASAGTGKTYSITSLYLRLLLERRLTVEEILVVTFTEAATAELHERIRDRLRSAVAAFESGEDQGDPVLGRLLAKSIDHEKDRIHLALALSGIDNAAVFTIHGFCHRVLQQHALETGFPFDLELTGSIDELLCDIVDDFWVSSFYALDPRLALLVRKKVSPRLLRDFSRLVARYSEYPVVGQVPASHDIERQLSDFVSLYKKVRKVWGVEQEALRDFFSGVEGLTASFQGLLQGGLLGKISRFLEGPEPESLSLPFKSELLAAENIFQPKGEVFTATALKKGNRPLNPFFAPWGELVQLQAQLTGDCQSLLLSDCACFVRKEFAKRLREKDQLSFDDLLSGLASALAGAQGARLARSVRKKFPAALIDEFQDTDPVQYRIFQTLYGSGSDALFLIGDPKQAIYAFRGADIHAYLNAAENNSTSRHSMDTNWRTDPDLVAAVNFLFTSSLRPFWDRRITYAQVRPRPGAENLWRSEALGCKPFQFLSVPDEFCVSKGNRLVKTELAGLVPDLVASDIAALLAGETKIGERPLAASDIAVLVRTNSQAAEMQEALRRQGVAGVLQSKESVLVSAEAEECLRVLRAVNEPGNEALLRKALATDLLGYNAFDLARLNDDPQTLQDLLGRFFVLSVSWRKNGVMQLLSAVWKQWRTCERLLPLADGERKLTNLRHLAELLQRAEIEKHFSPAMLIDWFSEAVSRSSGGEESELRLESDESAVQIVTVHRSKGLEYPVVYCPYLCFAGSAGADTPYGIWHDPEDQWQGRIVLFPDKNQRQAALVEDFAESLRLLYVALTRARHCCMLLWAPVSGYENSALAYLLHGSHVPSARDLDLATVRSLLKGFDIDDLHGQLAALVESGPGLHLRKLATARHEAEETPLPSEKPLVSLAAASPGRTFEQCWRIGSFSQLAAMEYNDEWAREPDPSGFQESEPIPRIESDILLNDFPKGAVAGNFFHKIFELVSFAGDASLPRLEGLVAELLVSHGYHESLWLSAVARSIHDVLHTPLSGCDTFCLKDLDDGQCLREMPFIFPLGDGKEGSSVLSASLLATPFVEHPQGLPSGYAAALASLSFAPLRGFLKGFVDLVFEMKGRWYILDYKSNFLGSRRSDYARAALPMAMAAHHYYLQYHLYTVALHRYLARRLPGYTYEKNFGGIFYLFFRGMHPAAEGKSGVFYDLPPVPRIEGLSAIFHALAGDVLS